MYKDGKWAKEIIALQKPDGSWGYFHTLSEPNRNPITTEQALRRLSVLGYTIEDDCIAKAVKYMDDCLAGRKQAPDRREKLHDWDIFTEMILSTWILRFTNHNPMAVKIAEKWAALISSAFIDGQYDHAAYVSAYQDTFAMKPNGGRLVDFVSFYQVSLISDRLNENTEAAAFDYVMSHKFGVYYIYGSSLNTLPDVFASKQASRYLAAMELMSAYRRNKFKLQFVVSWLNQNINEIGKWDMGAAAKDMIYLPLSDDWRRKEIREGDCTYRVQKFIDKVVGINE
jgi:hypothetical protein